jgi:hypothetical protein
MTGWIGIAFLLLAGVCLDARLGWLGCAFAVWTVLKKTRGEAHQ